MWRNPQFAADLATFTEEILNGKLHFLRSDISNLANIYLLKVDEQYTKILCKICSKLTIKTLNLSGFVRMYLLLTLSRFGIFL